MNFCDYYWFCLKDYVSHRALVSRDPRRECRHFGEWGVTVPHSFVVKSSNLKNSSLLPMPERQSTTFVRPSVFAQVSWQKWLWRKTAVKRQLPALTHNTYAQCIVKGWRRYDFASSVQRAVNEASLRLNSEWTLQLRNTGWSTRGLFEGSYWSSGRKGTGRSGNTFLGAGRISTIPHGLISRDHPAPEESYKSSTVFSYDSSDLSRDRLSESYSASSIRLAPMTSDCPIRNTCAWFLHNETTPWSRTRVMSKSGHEVNQFFQNDDTVARGSKLIQPLTVYPP